MQPRRARKIDANQQEIVRALRSLPGVTVAVDHDDFLVGYRGVTYWIELKTPGQRKKNGEWKAGAFKQSQLDLLDSWTGNYTAVSSLDEILKLLGIL